MKRLPKKLDTRAKRTPAEKSASPEDDLQEERSKPAVSQKSTVGTLKSEGETPESENSNFAFGRPDTALAKSEPDNYRVEHPIAIGTEIEQTLTTNHSPLTNMEVHHHPDVEKKGFKEYLLEGLMIFLAVTMGFFAESYRERSK